MNIDIRDTQKFMGNDLGDLLAGTGENQGSSEERRNERRHHGTSFTIDIHDIQKLMGNDLGDLLGVAGKNPGINQELLNEWKERKEFIWMRVDLEVDEVETLRMRGDARKSIDS